MTHSTKAWKMVREVSPTNNSSLGQSIPQLGPECWGMDMDGLKDLLHGGIIELVSQQLDMISAN